MKRLFSLLVVGAVLALAFYLARPEPTAPSATVTASADVARVPPEADGSEPRVDVPERGAPNENDFVAELRNKFSPFLDRAHARVRIVEQVMAFARAVYPDDWETRVPGLLAAAFPDAAAALIDRFHKVTGYHDWVATNRRALLQMTPEARRKALWDERYARFGDEAEEIWEAELRNQVIADTLTSFDGAEASLSTGAKLDGYLAAIKASHGEATGEFLERRRTELVNKFVSVESVQTELRAQSPEQRRGALREIRKSLGMPDDALERWAALDDQRQAAWQSGRAYMAERDSLIADNAPEGELDALRRRYFGEQADVIAGEEAGGFDRFAGERRIGRE